MVDFSIYGFLTDEILETIHAFNQFLAHFMPQLQQFLEGLHNFTSVTLIDYIDNFTHYLSWVYFFIPLRYLAPLLFLSVLALTIRIILAIVNLIWP